MSRRIAWSGGFDSTALVLDALRTGWRVDPVVFDMGCTRKEQLQAFARAEIRRQLPRALAVNLRDESLVTRNLFGDRYWQLAQTYETTSTQAVYLLAAAEELHGIELAYLKTDGLVTRAEDRDFLTALKMTAVLPYIGRDKSALLAAAGPEDVQLLQETWSCEMIYWDRPDTPQEHDHESVVAPCGRCRSCESRVVPLPTWHNIEGPYVAGRWVGPVQC